MRNFSAVVLALALFASNALAGDNTALAPGKPAGLTRAQGGNSNFYIITGAMLLVGGVAFLISTDHSTTASIVFGANAGALVPGINSPATTTTTTTR
jgi:hypothetical protein